MTQHLQDSVWPSFMAILANNIEAVGYFRFHKDLKLLPRTMLQPRIR